MADSDVLRGSQIGFENTSGTAVAAVTRLQSINIYPKPINATEMLKSPRGTRVATQQVGVKGSHTQAAVEGYGSYNDLALLLCTHLKAATITTPGGATLARDWDWTLTSDACETPKSITVENFANCAGTNASRFAYGVLQSLKLDFDGGVKVSGEMVGQLLAEEGVTQTTSGVTTIADVPISEEHLSWYTASVLANLSTSPLLEVYKGDWSSGDRRSPLFPQRQNAPSFTNFAETEIACTAHLEMAQDSQSDQMMRQARTWATRYLEQKFVGPLIEPGMNYELSIITAYKVENPDRGPVDEVYGGMYDLTAVHDATLGGFAKIRIRCSLTALPSATNLAGGQQPGALITSAGGVTS